MTWERDEQQHEKNNKLHTMLKRREMRLNSRSCVLLRASDELEKMRFADLLFNFNDDVSNVEEKGKESQHLSFPWN